MYINVDLGEEIRPNLEIERAVIPYINACNIACGGHAGNAYTIRETMKLAVEKKVKCGAHPSYPDRINFGRTTLNISNEKLKESILNQLQLFQSVADELNIPVHHIKMHGALYNDSANDANLAQLIIDIVKKYHSKKILFVPAISLLSKMAKKNNIKVHHEVFGDRMYNDDLSLVIRNEEGALIIKKEKLQGHLHSILTKNAIITKSGMIRKLEIQTICMHSDHIGAIENIKYLASEMANQNT